MKIKEIQVCRLQPPEPLHDGPPQSRPGWGATSIQATPMNRFEEGIRPTSGFGRPGGLVWAKAIAEDGTWGAGCTDCGSTSSILIRDCLAPMLVGKPVGAIDLCNDLMWRGTLGFGNEGLTARAVAAVDLALWDLWGHALDQPVYSLAGGPARTEVEAYATGNDVDWNLELGFNKFKLARPFGPYDGQAGIDGTVELMAQTRNLIGPDADLKLDCWMAFDVDFAVRLCEALRPYRMRWMEEMLPPQDWSGHRQLRQRLPWQSLATGEHWSTRHPGMRAIEERLVDLIQADIMWIGGFTEAMKLAHFADAAGIQMCLHVGANDNFGQHWTFAMPNTPLIEFFQASAPGIPLEGCHLGAAGATQRQVYRTPPGVTLPKDGKVGLPPGPGFGHEIPEEWLVPYFD